MGPIEIAAHAKINLSLDVLGKREDGYHELRMIMQSLELHDTVSLEASGSGIGVECDSRSVPSGSGNIAYKAAAELMDRYGIKSGVRISIRKRIPVAAGLGGGSADAAAVLKGLDRMFSLGLEAGELAALGKGIGADVPFCITGGTALAEGIGERLTGLGSFAGVDVVLIKPKIGVSTAWVYKNLDLSRIKASDRPDTELMIKAVSGRDIRAAAANMKNVLERVTAPRYGIIGEAERKLEESGAFGSMMSGSGPTVFGLFPDRDSAARAWEAVSKDGRWQCYITRTAEQ